MTLPEPDREGAERLLAEWLAAEPAKRQAMLGLCAATGDTISLAVPVYAGLLSLLAEARKERDEARLEVLTAMESGANACAESHPAMLADLEAARDRLAAELERAREALAKYTSWTPGVGMKAPRKPTHGPCCTCQACGHFYDDFGGCVCEHNAIEAALALAESGEEESDE